MGIKQVFHNLIKRSLIICLMIIITCFSFVSAKADYKDQTVKMGFFEFGGMFEGAN